MHAYIHDTHIHSLTQNTPAPTHMSAHSCIMFTCARTHTHTDHITSQTHATRDHKQARGVLAWAVMHAHICITSHTRAPAHTHTRNANKPHVLSHTPLARACAHPLGHTHVHARVHHAFTLARAGEQECRREGRGGGGGEERSIRREARHNMRERGEGEGSREEREERGSAG